MEDQCVITRQVTVAAGVFAPGHLGELTQIVPFEMVDAALAAAGTAGARVRVLPSRVVVYLLLAGGLFAGLGYRQVWHKLTAGLGALAVANPSDNALWQARARLGAAPLRWLFDLLRGPATALTTGAVRWHGLLVCAIDGTTMAVPDSPRNLAAYSRQPGSHGGSGYPLLRLVALVACGTRTIIDAVFTATSCGEQDCTRRLRRSLHAGMVVLLDRNFDIAALLGQLAATSADLLVRVKVNRKLPVLRRYRDGSYLSQIGAVPVRVIECEITIATSAGRHTGTYRLATTLLDHRQHPAAALITLYHERWEIETAYLELKSSLLGSRVLRARSPAGIAQEVYALLTCYQVLRIAITDAIETAGGTDPDRGSFTIALNAARDLLTQAAAITAGTTTDLTGAIGRRVLDNLLPSRRLRVSPRIVKRAISKHQARGPNVNRRSYKATLQINILTDGP
ncbi:MAG TPA: IS4 family transposase [Streptosporangiaceae bacterium]|nr:IS4 family transposase [Streptosporangiaceae bacterium]